MPLAFFLLFSSAVFAEVPGQNVYRWTDENGQVHYGTRAPGADAQRIMTHTPRAARNHGNNEQARAEKRRKLLESYQRERQLKREQEQQREEEERRKAVRCKQLIRHWKNLNHSGPIYYQDAQGGRRFLDEGERQAEKGALQKQMKETCGKLPGLY